VVAKAPRDYRAKGTHGTEAAPTTSKPRIVDDRPSRITTGVADVR